jgi:hypothetical protein
MMQKQFRQCKLFFLDLFIFFFSVLLTLIAVLILLATGMHIARGHKNDLQMDDTPRTGYEPILSRTTTTVTPATTNPVDEEDEATPLISRPRRVADAGKIYAFEIDF